jgi:CRP/FNR family transcriptional regulator, cyclic AMP receptor protein
MLNLFHNSRLPERLRELKKMVLFIDLTRREMRVVDGFMHDRTYLKGEIIFDAGEEGQALYLILKGKALVCHQDQVDNPIALLEAGSFFGELALLDDGPRSAQVRAAENCTVVVLFRGDFVNLMQSHALIASKISLQLGRHLCVRLRKALRDDDQELL